MKCEKCGGDAEFVSQKSVYAKDAKDADLSIGTKQLYKCEICKHEQKEFLFHSNGRYDFASFSQPDG